MTSAYGSFESFGSRVSSKSIIHNTYTGRRIKIRSKATPIHGPVHKSYLNYLYSRSYFSRLPKADAKKLIYFFSHKVSYPVLNGFITNDSSIHFHICDHSIFTFGI